MGKCSQKFLVTRLAACAGAARVHHTADRRCIAFLELPLAARGKEKRKDLTFSFPPGFERNVSRSLRKAGRIHIDNPSIWLRHKDGVRHMREKQFQ
jgi:hypothetical protein